MQRVGSVALVAALVACAAEPTRATPPAKPPSVTTVTVTVTPIPGPSTGAAPPPPRATSNTPPAPSDADRVIAGLRPRFRACFKAVDSDGGLSLDAAPLRLQPERGPDGALTRLIPDPRSAKTEAIANCILKVLQSIEQERGDAGVIRIPVSITTQR